jgi:hypothetical protein
MRQLDLFLHSQERRSATVFNFPLHRRAAFVRQTATELASRDYQAGRKYWAGHVRALRQQMRNEGVIKEQIDLEIERYTQAVANDIRVSAARALSPRARS